MRCPLADTHDYVPVVDPDLGEVEICRDCDVVAYPFGTTPSQDEPVYGLIGAEDW